MWSKPRGDAQVESVPLWVRIKKTFFWARAWMTRQGSCRKYPSCRGQRSKFCMCHLRGSSHLSGSSHSPSVIPSTCTLSLVVWEELLTAHCGIFSTFCITPSNDTSGGRKQRSLWRTCDQVTRVIKALFFPAFPNLPCWFYVCLTQFPFWSFRCMCLSRLLV